MKRVAIIDLGTNSVRFDVHEIKGRETRHLHRERQLIRLGQGAFARGKLSKEAVARTIRAFKRFDRKAREHEVGKVIAFGTSVLRDAAGVSQLLEEIRQETGIEVKVIPGKREARLIAQGVLANEKGLRGRYALVDIGGGSTEISLCEGKKALRSMSLPLGAARLEQLFLAQDPPKPEAVAELRAHARRELVSRLRSWPATRRILGSSGTIRGLARVLDQENLGFGLAELEPFVERILPLSKKELLAIPGVEARRADLMLAGALLFGEVMRALGATRVRTTEYSLRHGILDEEMKKA